MKTETRNRLTMTKGPVSARIPSRSDQTYTWVWVLPLPDGRFRVATVDIPKHLVDNDECLAEEDFDTPYLKIVDTVDDIDGAVSEGGADPDELTAPWHNDFPL